MNKKGFSLIECMVYCMIIAILFMIWFHGMVISHTTCMQQAAHTTQLNDLYAAQDMLIRDIHQAPARVDTWKFMSKSALIWHTNNKDIGWTVRDNRLIRIEGHYDVIKQRWRSKKQSVVLNNVEDVVFDTHEVKNYIINIECQLTLHNKQIIHIPIALHNGVLNG